MVEALGFQLHISPLYRLIYSELFLIISYFGILDFAVHDDTQEGYDPSTVDQSCDVDNEVSMSVHTNQVINLIQSIPPSANHNRTSEIARKPHANKPATAAKGIPVHSFPRLRPHLNVEASSGPATSPPIDCKIARAE